jgi:hypothetical protein
MADLLFFSHHNTYAWWNYLAKNLNFTQSTKVISDLRGEGDICIVDDFYRHLNTKECAQRALAFFSEQECDDIILRCRVLRNLNRSRALSMIGAMSLVFEKLINEEKPKAVISFIIDRYLLDVFQRLLQRHHIPFIEITASIVPDYIMLMGRGALLPVRQPNTTEVEHSRTQLIKESFTPSYVANKKYTPFLYWRTFLYFKLRACAFQMIRYLRRDPLNLHYLDALSHLQHKPRLLDYKVLRYLSQDDWKSRLASIPVDKRVFLALQLLPEASLDYWLKDNALLDHDASILELCRVLGEAGFVIFVKDHPLQFGFRKRALIQQLMDLPYVVLLPYDTPATRLIRECSVTVTFTGTVGFQSVLAGRCSVVSDPYYANEEHFIHFRNRADIASLPQKIAAFQSHHQQSITETVIDKLVTKVLAASIPGDLFSFKRFNPKYSGHIQRVHALLDSFNRYLPQFLIKSDETPSP